MGGMDAPYSSVPQCLLERSKHAVVNTRLKRCVSIVMTQTTSLYIQHENLSTSLEYNWAVDFTMVHH